VDLGYRYLETDVHLSSDGVLFAFHDSNLRARTGVDADIADLSAAHIDALLVDGIAPVPRLADIFLMWPLARLNIDAKSDAAVLPLIRAVRDHAAIDRVCLGAFSDRRVKKFRADLGPSVCTSMGRLEAARFYLAGWGLADARNLSAACAQVPFRSWPSFVTRRLIDVAHEHGIQVHYWTVDDPADINKLIDLGADGIMTDEPRILRDTLINRGVWVLEGAPTP